MEFPKLTRNQWIAVAVFVLTAAALSMKFTRWWDGKAIEVSVENTATLPVFAYLDNTGRHGTDTITERLQTTDGKQTPEGLLLMPSQMRSFGTAVGLGDSPMLHVLPVNGALRADASLVNDCPFDTLSFKRLELPNRHVKIKWNGKSCEVPQ